MAFYRFEQFPRRVSVGERRFEAEQLAKELQAKGEKLQPVRVEGNAIARTFWGKAWCTHLEQYSDLANRLPRGRSYLRNGSVIHLEIAAGRVSAKVSGSSLYDVEVTVAPLKPKRWEKLVESCGGQVESVIALLEGRLPEKVVARLADRDEGLFPAPEELEMSCSCPDSAALCKHLAAVLYGIGARLDTEPALLFVLRGVDQQALIGNASTRMTEVGQGDGVPELKRENWAGVFGIEFEATTSEPKARPSTRRLSKKKPAPRNGR